MPDLIQIQYLILCFLNNQPDKTSPIFRITSYNVCYTKLLRTDKVRGLDQGADDFITKPFEREELFARIRAGLRRGVTRSPEQKLIICGDLHVNLSTREVIRNGLSLELTKTEYDLLECLIINKGIVMTRSQLIEQVWGYDFGGDTNILDVYIRYLRNKIDYPFDRKLIRTIRGVGYSLKE